jgi:hypothetical protein
VLAAFEAGAELQLVTGRRGDLVRVLDRTEREIAIGTRHVSVVREFERLAAGWGRFAYQEAAEGFGMTSRRRARRARNCGGSRGRRN